MRKIIRNFNKKCWLVGSLFVGALSFFTVGGLTLAKADATTPTWSFESGASIKTDGDGLRFRLNFDKATRDYVVENDTVTMGFYITQTHLLESANEGWTNVPKIEVGVSEEKIYTLDGGVTYHANGCVYNFFPQNRTKDYSAMAFINDNGSYSYSALSDSRGIYSTLNLFMTDDDTTKANVNTIMSTYDWLGTADYPIVMKDATDYANISALVNAGVSFEGSYLKLEKDLFVEGLPTDFLGTFTNDSAKIYSYGYTVNNIGEQRVGTIELPTATKINCANEEVATDVIASSVTFKGEEVAIDSNTIQANEIGEYKVTFAGDDTTMEKVVSIYVRNASYANEIEAFSDGYYANSFYQYEDTIGGSEQKGATISYKDSYADKNGLVANGVIQIDVAYDSTKAGKNCGFNLIPRAMTQADLAEYDYVIVRALVDGSQGTLERFALGCLPYPNDRQRVYCADYTNWAAGYSGIWYDYKIDLTEVIYEDTGMTYREALTDGGIMSLELPLTGKLPGDVTIYIDSITAGKNTFGNEIIATEENNDGTYALNEEVTLSINEVNNAQFTVTDPNGDNVPVTDNKFTPTEYGKYTITSNYLGVATKEITVTVVRVQAIDNEIEAFSDGYYENNFYWTTSAVSVATMEWAESYEAHPGATGVLKIVTATNEADSTDFCKFNLVPRAMTQASLTEYDYVVVRAKVTSYNAGRISKFYLGCGKKESSAQEDLGNPAGAYIGQWYDYKIELTADIKTELANGETLSLKVAVMNNKDCTIYIDSIMVGKNA